MTVVIRCHLCRALVRVPVQQRRVATDPDGRPVVAIRAPEVVHLCQAPKERT